MVATGARSVGLHRLNDRLREALERLLDILAGLRGRVENGGFVEAQGLRSVRVRDLAPLHEIGFVPERVDGHGTNGVADTVDPFREVVEGRLPRDVEDGQDPLRAVEV